MPRYSAPNLPTMVKSSLVDDQVAAGGSAACQVRGALGRDHVFGHVQDDGAVQ